MYVANFHQLNSVFLSKFCDNVVLYLCRCTRWLRHSSTSRKVAGSITERVFGIFHLLNPSGRTMALGSTKILTEMSTTDISWGVKVAGA